MKLEGEWVTQRDRSDRDRGKHAVIVDTCVMNEFYYLLVLMPDGFLRAWDYRNVEVRDADPTEELYSCVECGDMGCDRCQDDPDRVG